MIEKMIQEIEANIHFIDCNGCDSEDLGEK